MVREISRGEIADGKQHMEYAGLPGDDKPIKGLLTGSVFIEIDPTNNKVSAYFFDEVSETWTKVGG